MLPRQVGRPVVPFRGKADGDNVAWAKINATRMASMRTMRLAPITATIQGC